MRVLFVMLAAWAMQTRVVPPKVDYLFFVGSEGNDHIALVRFGPNGAKVDHQIKMGFNPTEPVGPHGLGVSPDGRYYYVSTAHGTPEGSLWKYTTKGDTLVGRVELGLFPATLQVTPDGAYVYVVNFNLYGDMITSSVSVVYTDGLTEIARIPTCTMPHGSRLNASGTRHYSACMMDDMLVEIDARNLKVGRWFSVATGAEHGVTSRPAQMTVPTCSPTWAQPSPDGTKVWVACNKTNDVVEIDVKKWTMTRRIPFGEGVYNLAVTHNGKLLVGTNKRGQSVSIVDVASGKELARIPTTRKVTSGVAVTPDDRYAFVTDEGIGSQPGTVDVIDLDALQKVASIDVGPQAGGIDFWKTE
ncbi:MAG TPA: YncE family protein [Gemmatimonadaceae bacterium]|jgi:DNA-binding beta-propeller fold protein YncE|nr:YncE family protein [Gemmatimonadaceae bacterium]